MRCSTTTTTKSAIVELKKCSDWTEESIASFKGFYHTEERINELDDRTSKTIQLEEQKEEWRKPTEHKEHNQKKQYSYYVYFRREEKEKRTEDKKGTMYI